MTEKMRMKIGGMSLFLSPVLIRGKDAESVQLRVKEEGGENIV